MNKPTAGEILDSLKPYQKHIVADTLRRNLELRSHPEAEAAIGKLVDAIMEDVFPKEDIVDRLQFDNPSSELELEAAKEIIRLRKLLNGSEKQSTTPRQNAILDIAETAREMRK